MKIIYDASMSSRKNAFYGFNPYEKGKRQKVWVCRRYGRFLYLVAAQIADASIEIEKMIKDLSRSGN